MTRLMIAIPLTLMAVGCASPAPVLYPNAHLEAVGRAAAERDIEDCQAQAEAHGASAEEGKGGKVAGSTAAGGGAGAATGAAGGAVRGVPGTGAAIGAATGAAAGLVRGLFTPSQPSQVYKRFVENCLWDLGYEPIGWD